MYKIGVYLASRISKLEWECCDIHRETWTKHNKNIRNFLWSMQIKSVRISSVFLKHTKKQNEQINQKNQTL